MPSAGVKGDAPVTVLRPFCLTTEALRFKNVVESTRLNGRARFHRFLLPPAQRAVTWITSFRPPSPGNAPPPAASLPATGSGEILRDHRSEEHTSELQSRE